MEEKKVTKISLSTFFLILVIIAIIVMGIFIYKLNNDKTVEIQNSTELQAKVDSLNETVSELQEKINKVSETVDVEDSIQENSSNALTTNSSNKNDVTYTVSVKDEVYATIKATKNGKTISKEFEMSAAITNTSVIDIFNLGKVVLVAETGGEYYGIQVYRLSQDYTTGKTLEIKNVGSIQYYL